MHFIFHTNSIAEVVSDAVIISSGQDVLDLIYAPELAEVSSVILHQKNIAPDFFILSTGIAGEVLQKFVNYRCRLSIVGDFSAIESKSLHTLNVNSAVNQICMVNNSNFLAVAT